jgi:hypothetical protein
MSSVDEYLAKLQAANARQMRVRGMVKIFFFGLVGVAIIIGFVLMIADGREKVDACRRKGGTWITNGSLGGTCLDVREIK